MELVEYEQCPWDEVHVRSIYPIIKEFIVDREWHPYGPENQYLYRIWDQRIFQVIVRGSESLKREIMAAAAPDSIEDAEWTVIRFDDEYLGLTSKLRGPIDIPRN